MSDERLRELGERYEDYTVYDNAGEKIGKVDDIFVDETDREEYIGVKMGLFGLSGTTLIPMDIARVNELERTIEVSESKDHVKDAPNFRDDDEITHEYEERIRRHFGLESFGPSAERGSYGRYTGAATGGRSAEGGTGTEGPVGRRTYRNREDAGPSGSTVDSAGAAGAPPTSDMRDPQTRDRSQLEDERYQAVGARGEFGEPGDRATPDTPTGPGEAEEGLTRREPAREEHGDRVGFEGTQTGDLGRMGDEGHREAYLEGYRQGLREGLGEVDTATGDMEARERGFGQGGPGDQSRGTPEPGEETRDTPRRSDESQEREESGLTRVWRRLRH